MCMLDYKRFGKILQEIDEEELFNQFIINLFGYNITDFNKLIIRYKIDNELIIDIFDYKEENKYIRYYFTDNNNQYEIEDNNIVVKIINLKDYYNNFNKYNKYSLFSSLFYEKNIDIIENNLSNLFNNNINNIIMNHLKK